MHQTNQNWQRLGSVEDLKRRRSPATRCFRFMSPHCLSPTVMGEFGAVSGRCNHAYGGPLGQGSLRDDYIVCALAQLDVSSLNRIAGAWNSGRAAPRYALRIQDGDLYVDITAATQRIPCTACQAPVEPRHRARSGSATRGGNIHDCHERRVSALFHIRRSASGIARLCWLARHRNALDPSQRFALPRLRSGYYSKSAHACTWPCTITQMDPADQLDAVYEALVFWGPILC